ncbi:MAG: leucine-rich repeat protein, partial [Candidatus Methanomethylophilaceae archaeon]|nr:leucine-rich repeat protein [Candidatus Methanomethylophilaceae archaeon]
MYTTKDIQGATCYSIGEKSFYQCKSLSQVSIPMVANIKDEAFMDCTSLREVFLSDVLMSIGDRSFLNCNLIEKISIPSSI